MTNQGKKRIAVLGGGIASLSTVFELTSRPDWREHYDITVYQQGHRLGGKCASGRTTQGGVERIEEHGLHVFFGFYDNAFDLMRRAYAELETLERPQGERPLSFERAFLPRDLILLGDDKTNPMRSWTLLFPRRPGSPGLSMDQPVREEQLTLGAVLSGLLEVAVGQLLFVADRRVAGLGAPSDGKNHELERYLAGVEASSRGDLISGILTLLGRVGWLLRVPLAAEGLVEVLHVLQAACRLLDALPLLQRAPVRVPLAFALARVRATARVALETVGATGFVFSQAETTIDLMLTISIGVLRENLLSGRTDWFALDELEYRDWLRKHGARKETAESPPLATLADATFSDSRYHGSGAGTTLHLTLRMLLQYKQAILFKFAAGMGETVIAPLYRVLEQRGVRFAFFQRVERLLPGKAGGRPVVGAIEIREQVTLREPGRGYRPLQLFSDGMLCFPSKPDYAQLVEGDELARGEHDLESAWNDWDDGRPLKRLEHGVDYDCVILGISIGALSSLCAPLVADAAQRTPPARGKRRAPSLTEMLRNVATVETMAVQLWLKPPFAALGAPSENGIGVSYPQPFDTWAEMDHLLARERWPADARPGAIVYMCSAMDEPYGYVSPPSSDRDHPRRQREQVRRSFLHWLDKAGGSVFRKLHRGAEGFDFDALVDVEERRGEARFDGQYHAATLNPSDRYVLSLPGTNKYRLRPHESGFCNLVLTGDWTLNAISAGCVESAVLSGRDAARALIGEPRAISGDWLTRLHPELRCAPMLPRLPSADRTVRPDAAAARSERNSETGGEDTLSSAGPGAHVRQQGVVLSLPVTSPQSRRVAADPHAYLSRPLDMIPRPNYVCNSTLSDWFFFRADAQALQRLCDQLLNHEASPTRYTPLVPLVAFVAARLGKTYADKERIAYIPESDFAFWIPVKAVAKEGREHEHKASPIAWLQPCLWVDSCPAVVGGREVYGVNKVLATLRVPEPGRPCFSVDTIAIRTLGEAERTQEPMELAKMARILELEVDAHPSLLDHVESIVDLFTLASFDELGLAGSDALDWLRTLFEQVRERRVPLVALKQFPDAADADRVCYKAVVEAYSRATTPIDLRRRPGDHLLRLYRYESHPIAELFGLEVTPDVDASGIEVDLVEPVFAMSASFDFVLEQGKVVFDFMDLRETPPGNVASSA